MQFIPNTDITSFESTNKEWIFIQNVLRFLNHHDQVPFLTEDNFIDMECMDCFSFSSKKALYIGNIIEEALRLNLLQNYVKEIDDDISYLDKMNFIYQFQDFVIFSGGFYVKHL